MFNLLCTMPRDPMRLCLRVPLLLALGCASASGQIAGTAQASVASAPAFEVAAVKRNVSGRIGGSIDRPPAGTVTYTNVMLRLLIREAYQIGSSESQTFDAGPYVRLVGKVDNGSQPEVPRFDVRAKPPDGTQPTDRRAMMRTLPEDRFKLKVHRERREMPVYVVTLATAGHLGPNLAPSGFDCRAYNPERRYGVATPEPVDTNGRSWCPNYIDVSHPGVVTDRSAGPMTTLVERVQNRLDRLLVDATGLSGNLEWTWTFDAGPDAPRDLPSMLTALDEQLGLKVTSGSGFVEVLVIDHVEMPTPD